MTSLLAVSDHLPSGRVPIEALAGEYGLTPMELRIFRRYHGLGEVARDPGGSLLDLLRGAAAGLAALRGREHRVRYVLHARSFPTVVPFPHDPVRELCAELGLDEGVPVFSVGHHACASGLLAIDAAGRLLAADGDPDALALVLAGEKAFTPEAGMVPGSSFFGEGAGACLVSPVGGRDRVLAYAADLRGEFDTDAEEQALEFQRIYGEALAATVLAAVERAGLALEAVTAVLPHNVNRAAWHQVCRLLGYPRERVVLDNVPAVGHVFCADHFVNHRTARQRGLLRRGEPYVLAAAGAGRGATFAAMVLQH
ncbi:3-oxoacyl-[acyl-carrier-protein] synthase III C-terminal domain-containing protein [Kitasatospora cineracea]|uniref:3-oxoacyl-[acyl-carrier-protein] synthase-3 n=1 Tax=Kitasatospora cineracea TaxID=88074 RepID=A0A3N4R3N6_9ACTN|nr:3-oxoacyl-[acyl-carrier-protein] synthase III C-terminal domain-containing protein [Kitasatospora cineracea]ROR35701.1 3-oxoacyl-[acyl-carrier-protein] synthase-3 [Kitasatospora cineracea]RPE27792.1 3-oxoacyl-[acyl-carrier-protein] synthase-3 [Kitasatospora cineracea]